jgi:hypothetical protein
MTCGERATAVVGRRGPQLPRGQRVAILDWVSQTPQPLPMRLEPGSHWTGLVAVDPLKADLDRHYGPRKHWHIRAIMGDSAGRAYKAKRVATGWHRLLPRRQWISLD